MLLIDAGAGGGGCGCVPVPLAAMAAGEFVASLPIEIVAVRAAAFCGAKVTVAVAAAPGAMVDPLAIPLTEKLLEAPVMLTLLTVAVAVPVLVNVTCCDALLPTITEP